ncbi:MAG: DUF4097 family beta strand repeat protein [Lachnospiraceae bacterium]|nr:DUF4097 family beta strand repeat protein [Lachnospiraceae bacterium]
MNRLLRDAGKGLIAFLAAITLIVQSVLPVYAGTAGAKSETSASGYTVSEETGFYTLDYFDRIAINSVRGTLTIKPGEDFTISFPNGWEHIPSFSVQDDILVVSGRKSADQEKSSNGSVVVIGEDEPAADGNSAEAAPAAEGESAEAEPASSTETSEANGAEPEIVITIPSGIGLDTLRVAMENGNLIITDITANSVTIQSGGGSLVMKDVSLGTVDIYTDSGSVSVSECNFNSLNIGMAEGRVEINSDESLARCRMEIGTGDGEISYNGTSEGDQYMQPGNGKRFLTIQMGSGDISIKG